MASAPFLLESTESNKSFAPPLYPEQLRVRKQRNLDRQENFCDGEDISDSGSKNREIHISGRVRGPGMLALLNNAADADEVFDLVTDAWVGEVRIKEVEYEIMQGYDPRTGEQYWQYTIDVVSTGRDEDFDDLSTGFSGGGDDAFSDDDITESGLGGEVI